MMDFLLRFKVPHGLVEREPTCTDKNSHVEQIDSFFIVLRSFATLGYSSFDGKRFCISLAGGHFIIYAAIEANSHHLPALQFTSGQTSLRWLLESCYIFGNIRLQFAVRINNSFTSAFTIQVLKRYSIRIVSVARSKIFSRHFRKLS